MLVSVIVYERLVRSRVWLVCQCLPFVVSVSKGSLVVL